MATSPAMELGQIPMTAALGAALARASEIASASGGLEITLEHLLYALCEDPDAIAVLDASRVDIARLKIETAAYLSSGQGGPPTPLAALTASADTSRILEAASSAARGGRRRDITGAIVLAAIVGDARSFAAHLLQSQGLTFDEAIRALQRSLAQPSFHETQIGMTPAEDVLARARERVQSRAAPSLREIKGDTTRPATPPAQPSVLDAESTSEPAPAAEWAGVAKVDQLEPATEAEPLADSVFSKPEPEVAANGDDDVSAASEPAETAPQRQSNSGPAQDSELASVQPTPTGAGADWPPPSYGAPAPPRYPEADAFGAAHAPQYPQFEFPKPPRPEDPPSPGQIAFQIPRPIPVRPPPIPSTPRAPTGPEAAQSSASGFGGGYPSAHLPAAQPPWLAGEPSYARPDDGGLAGFAGRGEPEFGAPKPESYPPLQSGFESLGGASLKAPRGVDSTARQPDLGRPSSLPAPVAATPVGQPSASRRERRPRPDAGQLAENIPRVMRVGNTARVEIRIAKASVKAVAEGLEGGGSAWRHDLIITKAMSVRLRAPDGGFFIETASPETQWIENQLGLSSDDFASWRFLVTPQTRGRARLQIIVSARTIGADGVAAETALPDQVVDVKVRTNYKRAVARWTGWIIAAIAGGALAKFGEGGFEAANLYIEKFMN